MYIQKTLDLERIRHVEGHGLALPQDLSSRGAQGIFPVRGDCMEGAGIPDGGFVAVDFRRWPAPPRYRSKGGDGSFGVCLCWATFPGREHPELMVKEYLGVWGTRHQVGTRFDLRKGEHSMNCGMGAEQIFGAVFAAWDTHGKLLWERDPGSFPDFLSSAPTIKGSNCGAPIGFRLKGGAPS
ncbi:hypothetical protein D3Z48_18220 [Clostridiaceae bacterium]|nr:hypothetical protein [Clostridiaceae bacterium]